MRIDHDDSVNYTKLKEDFDRLIKLCRQTIHQLNNQLTFVLVNTQLVLLVLTNEKLRGYLTEVELAARDIDAMTNLFQESIEAINQEYLQRNILDKENLPEK